MPRILVVEDEPGIALALEDDLTMEGYQVEVASDGLTASKRAREGGFDLILLDVMLPGKDGFEVCRELRARIAALLRRGQPAATERPLRIGDAEVDFDRAEVRRGGEVTPLTPLEFKLLELFSRARGRILTRDQLVEGAWGVNVFVSERVVDNHIGNLRKKLEPDPDQPRYLKNVRGLGYRFDV